MVRAKSLAGSRDEILRAIQESSGEIVEAIVFVEEAEPVIPADSRAPASTSLQEEPPAVHVADVDYSRNPSTHGRMRHDSGRHEHPCTPYELRRAAKFV